MGRLISVVLRTFHPVLAGNKKRPNLHPNGESVLRGRDRRENKIVLTQALIGPTKHRFHRAKSTMFVTHVFGHLPLFLHAVPILVVVSSD